MNPEPIISQINSHCKAGHYFWAAGLVRETMTLWQSEALLNKLHTIARIMVLTYRGEVRC